MDRGMNKVVLIKRRTRYEELKKRYSDKGVKKLVAFMKDFESKNSL